MKHLLTRACVAPVLCFALVTPTLAQDLAQDQNQKPPSLMERGAQLFFEGLMQEMEPALDGLQGLAEEVRPSLKQFVEQMGPALGRMVDQVEDWSVYEAPELMPNGDIVIRRKPKAEPDPQAPQGQDGPDTVTEPLDI